MLSKGIGKALKVPILNIMINVKIGEHYNLQLQVSLRHRVRPGVMTGKQPQSIP